jgi:hypothetical protein
MKYIHFHALKEDLLPVLEAIETKGPLKYTRTGNFIRADFKGDAGVFYSGAEIPNLGKATVDSSHACDTYLVCKRDTPINLNEFQGVGGVERVSIDQLLNPDTVGFTAAGIWNEDIILEGRIATVSDSQASQELMKRFHSAIKKSFQKVRAFYVGPKALTLLESGKRLTMSAQSPREFDLAPVSTKN